MALKDLCDLTYQSSQNLDVTLDSSSSDEESTCSDLDYCSGSEAKRITAVAIIAEKQVVFAVYCRDEIENIAWTEENSKIRKSDLINFACAITGPVDDDKLEDFVGFWKDMSREKSGGQVLLGEDVAKRLRKYHLDKNLANPTQMLVAGFHREKPECDLVPVLGYVLKSAAATKNAEFECVGMTRHVETILEREYNDKMNVTTAIKLAERALLSGSYFSDPKGRGSIEVLTISATGFSETLKKTWVELHEEHGSSLDTSPGSSSSTQNKGAYLDMEGSDGEEFSDESCDA